MTRGEDTPEELEALYRLERAIDPIEPDVVARALRRFERMLPLGGGGHESGDAASSSPDDAPPGGGSAGSAPPDGAAIDAATAPVRTATAAAGTSLATGFTMAQLVATAVVAFAIGAGVGGGVVALRTESSGATTRVDAGIVGAPGEPRPAVPDAEPERVGQGSANAGARADLAPSTDATATTPAQVLDGGTRRRLDTDTQRMARERALLDAARFALARGDTDAALSSIESHEHRFPAGGLAEEREALAIQVLLRAGRAEQARERARAFVSAYPHSIQRRVADAALQAP